MSQTRLFFDDVSDALRADVQALGGYKAVGAMLWPEKAADAAGRLLADCLNTAKPEKLSPDQLILLLRLARAAGVHDAANFIGAETGYKVEPIEPENERAKLQREFIDSVARLESIRESLARIGADPIRAVK